MQIEFKLKRIVPVLLGLAFLWIIFLLSRFLLEAPENPNRNYVPANSSMVIRIDGNHFLKSAAYDLAYQTGDETIFNQLETLSRNGSRGKLRDAGIDFLSDVIVFAEPFENTTILGFLFNLSDEEKFKQVMPTILKKNQAFATNGEVGILLTDPSDLTSREKLSAHAEKLFVTGTKPAFIQKWSSQDGTLLDFELQGQSNSIISAASMQAKLNNSQIEFSGSFKSIEKPVFSSTSLKPDGFHVSTAIWSQQLQDSLKNMLTQTGFDFPDIARISVNYRGMELDGFAPMADLLLEFESPMDLSEIYVNDSAWKNLGFTVQETNGVQVSRNSTFQLMYKNTPYTVKIIDHKTIFIGQNPQNIQNLKSDHLLLLKGDLNKLTNLEGGGFGMNIGINLYPPYRTAKEFISSISKADLKIVPQNGKYILDGKIQFQEDKYPISETLKLILGLK